MVLMQFKSDSKRIRISFFSRERTICNCSNSRESWSFEWIMNKYIKWWMRFLTKIDNRVCEPFTKRSKCIQVNDLRLFCQYFKHCSNYHLLHRFQWSDRSFAECSKSILLFLWFLRISLMRWRFMKLNFILLYFTRKNIVHWLSDVYSRHLKAHQYYLGRLKSHFEWNIGKNKFDDHELNNVINRDFMKEWIEKMVVQKKISNLFDFLCFLKSFLS
jgi:hypothetical protein